jgi:hypothetical protein
VNLSLTAGLDKKQVILYALLFVGFFFPISHQGVLLPYRYLIIAFLLGISYTFFIKVTRQNLLFFLIINISLIVFTIAASLWFKEYSFGIYPNFFLLSVLLLLNYKDLVCSKYILYVQLIATWLIIALGIGIIIGSTPITQFLINNYSSGYEDLLPNMLSARKPVATLGTHSVASFLFFFLFLLNIKTYQANGRLIYLFTSIVTLLLLVFIRSNTALAYSVIAFIFLIATFRKRKASLFIFAGILVLFVLYVGVFDRTILDVFVEYDVLKILTSNENGLSGRYSNNSLLAPTIDYIIHNPFVPIGLAYSDKLYYTDSGIIIYVLRGSIILASAIYIGFYCFLKNNLLNKKQLKYIFLFFIIFEIGYPMLVELRVLCFIPFVVVYLNYLSTIKNVKSQRIHTGP